MNPINPSPFINGALSDYLALMNLNSPANAFNPTADETGDIWQYGKPTQAPDLRPSLFNQKQPIDPSYAIGMQALNTALLGISNSYNNRRNEQEALQRLNNPYMGLLPYNDGRSEDVRFGYKDYQQGGPFEELYNSIYEGLLQEEQPQQMQMEANVEQGDYDEEAIAQQRALLKKQIGREIVNNFNPTTEADYISSGNVEVGSNAELAFNHYLQKGLPEHVAAGIIGNLLQESNLNPHVKGDDGKATGIAQWHPDRFNNLKKWASKQDRNPYDLRTQLDFILEEPNEGSRMLKALLNTNTPEQAALTFSKVYERPNIKFANNKRRASYARALTNK